MSLIDLDKNQILPFKSFFFFFLEKKFYCLMWGANLEMKLEER